MQWLPEVTFDLLSLVTWSILTLYKVGAIKLRQRIILSAIHAVALATIAEKNLKHSVTGGS